MTTKTITVDYLARVEGETAIEVRVPGDPSKVVRLRIFEPPRFFEGFLVGRRYDEVGDIVARICGICPVSHMLTAIRALEKAMGVEPSEQTILLRRIAALSQVAASHLVHLYMLAMPDYMGFDGAAEMLPFFPDRMQRLVRMRKVFNDLTAVVAGGRALHPIGTVVGGFTRLPVRGELLAIRERLLQIRADARETVKMVADFETPTLKGDREYVALQSADSYAINQGRLTSNKGLDASEDDYYNCFEEQQVDYAMAKKVTVRRRGGLVVGALARLNLKYNALFPSVRDLARTVGFRLPDENPFHNNLAQSLEVVQAIEECVEMLGRIELRQEEPRVTVRPGEGKAVTEAPRGLLHHWYVINRKGVVEKANIITPTAHNFVNIESDLHRLVLSMADQPLDAIRKACEMLVRAYDPCFSCSVH
ncbi:MAG TPA: Ni/Fe hydrogenase subunit alpha [Candidatus Latescibacteria bacterium]|nr:Ni/Fe hydrogenase subunit alpha [Candidatus Latescibacterota bacterium]